MRRFVALLAVVVIVSLALSPSASAAPRSALVDLALFSEVVERVMLWLERGLQKIGGHMDPNGLDRMLERAEPTPGDSHG